MKLSSVKKYFFEQLKNYYSYYEIRSFFYFIMEMELSVSRSNIVINIDYYSFDIDKINEYIIGLKNNVPIQYLTNLTYFYGLKIKLNNKIFIPRQETEELVDYIVKSDIKKKYILDICSGSGCIAISLNKNIKNSYVMAMDKTQDAIKIAKENNIINSTNVEFINLDILKEKLFLDRKFDVIVSNPPYVSQDEKDKMKPNVLDYEPHCAIFVDNDPLVFYKKIIDIATDYLNNYGNLFFEINHKFHKQIENVLKKKNFFDIVVKKDLNCKFRIIRATYASIG